MNFTRLHFILSLLLLGTIVIVFLNLRQKNIEEPAKTKTEQPVAPVNKPTAAKAVHTERPAIKPGLAREAVAVAGEYWKITKKAAGKR